MAALDGRIDNLEDLRRTLGLAQTFDAANVLVGAYAKWGDDLLPRLRGEYAFVLWDDCRRRVLAARDPFGVRLLHYVAAKDRIWLATDADQFVRTGLIEPVPHDGMVVEFLTRRFRSLDRSFLRDVRQIPPGHAIVATAAESRTFDYRVLPEANLSFASTEECYRQFREHFATAVRRRVSSESPVLADLSGGCDSSAIVCVADRLLGEAPSLTPAIVAASAAYPGMSCDEGVYVDAVAKKVRIPVLKWDGRKASDLELREPILSAPGSRMVMAGGTDGFVDIARAHGADVVLGGAGGNLVGQPLGIALDEFADREWTSAIRHAFPAGSSPRRMIRNAYSIAEAFLPLPFSRIRSALPNRWPIPTWLAPRVRALAFLREAPPHGRRSFASHGQRSRWIELNRANIAMSLDVRYRHAAHRGLEMRYPFFDWDLCLLRPGDSFPTLAAPPAVRANSPRGPKKRPTVSRLPETGEGRIYASRINRVGIQVPYIMEIFEGTTWLSEDFVEQVEARRLLRQFRNEPASRTLVQGYSIWAMASLETWLRAISTYGTIRALETHA